MDINELYYAVGADVRESIFEDRIKELVEQEKQAVAKEIFDVIEKLNENKGAFSDVWDIDEHNKLVKELKSLMSKYKYENNL